MPSKNTVTITKARVIKAIKKETRLAPGIFITGDTKDSSCTVCAVGAVLKEKFWGYSELEIDLIVSENYQVSGSDPVNEILEEGRYWTALSYFFEQTAQRLDLTRYESMSLETPRDKKKVKALRKATIDFVKKNFPNRLKIALPKY